MKLEDLFDQLHALPTIPKVAQDLIRQFDDPKTNLDSLARNIELDPVIAAKLLRLANSAHYRGGRDSTSVEDAAMRVGFGMLRILVLASGVTGAFQVKGNFDIKGFWRHSFEVASISRLLAKPHGVDPETAFTCGMMHNIGELLIQAAAPQHVGALATSASSAGHAAEETLQLGFGYPEVGAELARRWKLPGVIQHAIAFQARPAQAPSGEALARLIAQAVLIADALDRYDGPTEEARQAVEGPLTSDLDLDPIFKALPKVIEANRAFTEVLS